MWYYVDELAYGIVVNSRSNYGLEDLLQELSDVLDNDDSMAIGNAGSIFVYVKSTYCIIDQDSANFTNRSPDTLGNKFTPPKHPVHHYIDNRPAPELSDKEISALNKIKEIGEKSPVWIRCANVYY